MTDAMVPLKYLAGINERSLPETTDPDFEFRYVDISAVGRGELTSDPQLLRFGDAPSRARRLLRDGDTIVSTVRTYLRAVWSVRGDPDRVVASTGFAVLSPHAVDPRYFAWWIQSDVFIEDVVGRSVGVSYPAINALEIGELPVRVPSLAKQRAIADYLDNETARIDALIAKKQRLAYFLQERRSRLTLAGVVGELTHDGSVRESGLEWAGTIPSHWNVALLRLVASQGTGHTPSRSHPEWWIPDECVVPWVTTGEVQQVRSDRARVITGTREKISHIGIVNSSAEIHPKGTVFLCRTASAGYSGIMGAAMATSQDFATWTCGELLDPEYLLFCLRAMRPDLLGRLATGSTHKTIYMPDIQALKIPVPPLGEQREIAALLTAEIDRSFAADDALAVQISLLVERRQTLITAVVTGEFAVPDTA